MDVTEALPWLLGLAALGVPLTYLAASLLVSERRPFRGAGIAAGLGVVFATALGAGWLATGAETRTVTLLGGDLAAIGPSLRIDGVTALMLGLVAFIALVIVRFSVRYVGAEPGRARYVRWLMATLAAVSLLVQSNSLLWLGATWVGTSLALHQLLTFFQDRPQALLAAHEKFLVSRVADIALLSAIGLLSVEVGGLGIDAVHAWAAETEVLPAGVQVATVLLVVGASLKCAQLPFHGWLTKVMEAPTPVSALLHAGVVNIGGFLMIRLSPLMVKAELAQTLLVAIGTTTVVVAALVMTTRVSVKVSLAWSTCAQMGFMLVQCGLGAYHLALLHLVAHSLYKAHAFLSTGSTVEVWAARALRRRGEPASLGRWVAAAFVGALAVAGVGFAFGVRPSAEPALWALGLVVCLSVAPLLVNGRGGIGRLAKVGFGAGAVAALYFTWHALFGHALEVPASAPTALQLGLVIGGFAVLFVLQAAMQARPDGALARKLYPVLHAGLYLDALFTRATFQLWPARLPAETARRDPTTVEIQEAR